MTDKQMGMLIVDDSKVAQLATKKLLQAYFDLHIASNSIEALEIIENEENLHLIFTELKIVEAGDYELIKWVRGHKSEVIRHMPVIIVSSGDRNEDARDKAFKLGATDFITKPFDKVDIIARSKAYSSLHMKTLSLESAASTLKDIATIDPVTKLMLPEFFQEKLIQDRSFTMRHSHDLSTLDIVIDEFDELQHLLDKAGLNDLCSYVGLLISQKIRTEDTLSYFGDAEYGVSLPAASHLGARILAERIRIHISESPFQFAGTNYEITVSIGIYVPNPTEEIAIATIIEQMQAAAQVAQIGGGNQIFLDPDVPNPVTQDQPEEVSAGTYSVDKILQQIESGEISPDSVDEKSLLQQIIPVFKVVSEKERLDFIERLLMISDTLI